jgi:hypothetical protein
MGPGEPDGFAQVMDQEQTRLHIVGIAFSVYVDLDVHGWTFEAAMNIPNLKP